ncbi:hypothetical protein PSHT_12630, partial [Puccinia striiformis]
YSNLPTHCPEDKITHILKFLAPAQHTQFCTMDNLTRANVIRTVGPNHVWCAHRDNKFQQFGIRIHCFVDHWSRKILGIYAHANTDDPVRIGVYFLQLATLYGGIPRKVSTHYQLEFIDMANFQLKIAQRYGSFAMDVPVDLDFSTQYQPKMEALWTRLFKEHHIPAMEIIFKEQEQGIYDENDEIHRQVKETDYLNRRLLFLFLWIPLFQTSLDQWVHRSNGPRTVHSTTLRGPDFSYSTPEVCGATNEIINVPGQDIELILQTDYPKRPVMHQHTPDWFHQLATTIQHKMALNLEDTSLGDVWSIFHEMLPNICAHLPTPSHAQSQGAP